MSEINSIKRSHLDNEFFKDKENVFNIEKFIWVDYKDFAHHKKPIIVNKHRGTQIIKVNGMEFIYSNNNGRFHLKILRPYGRAINVYDTHHHHRQPFFIKIHKNGRISFNMEKPIIINGMQVEGFFKVR